MIALALALSLTSAPDGEKPVLMVLYFENQTNRPEYDVMKKGLADLLITDLVAYDAVTVVERDRLEAVLGELKLQQTKAFDPATRVKLGKFVGAKYVVSGSMIGVAPAFSLKATLVEAATSKVVVAANVSGPAENLFDLEQELVGKLTAGIDARLTDPSASKKLRGIDVPTVLAYSKGLDLADQGKLEEAQRAFQELLSKKPIFYLPRDRVAALIKRMEEAVGRKENLLSGQGQKLLAAAEAILKQDFTRLTQARQVEYLAHKAWRSHLLMLGMRQHLSPRDPKERPVLPGNEAKVAALFKEIFSNEQSLWPQVLAYQAKHPQFVAPVIPPEARDVGLENVSPLNGGYFERFTYVALVGRVDIGNTDFTVWPTPISLDPKLGPEVEKYLMAELNRLFALKTNEAAEQAHRMILYSWLPYLSYAGRTEDGVAVLQNFLDAFPTSRHFEETQESIKQALGVTPCDGCWHPFEWAALAKKHLKECKGGSPWQWLEYRAKQGGVASIQSMVADAEKSCASKVGATARRTDEERHARHLLQNFYEGAVVQLARWNECALARDYATRYCLLETGEKIPTCAGGPKLEHCAGSAPAAPK